MKTVTFLGYDVKITYDDYDNHEVLVQDLKEISDICKTLENRDDSFVIEYKMKYKLENGTFLYTKEESYILDNPTTPKRELGIRKFNKLAQMIYHSLEVNDEDLQECADILEDILSDAKPSKDPKDFVDEIIKVYKRFDMSIACKDTQGAFKIEKYNEENIDWLKEAIRWARKV
jgi:hypothetical protein